jgi:hypothetical protein
MHVSGQTLNGRRQRYPPTERKPAGAHKDCGHGAGKSGKGARLAERFPVIEPTTGVEAFFF